ncbi:antibiotic biosynthesis monooxygenase family protein [Oceanobacillus salinisoli]|uniref:antibiotic biosynthesis monooxygenase family protein n=1 Tax=Oceanobacillus salinisoli TaxID=2678611 RepID=UPI0012E31DC9|nr:antibiotic biosynthesis monooxygenase [Oceanobacillus salinisoli]
MKAYMTNGTLDFLMKLQDKHPAINFFFMTNNGGALAYYEESEKQIFGAGRTYEVIKKSGELIQKGYVVMNTIAVMDDDHAVFEDRIKNNLLDKIEGVQAFRFLKPIKSNKYVVLTHWNSIADYEKWKESDRYKEAHQVLSVKLPAYYNDMPFTTTYFMHEEDTEKS